MRPRDDADVYRLIAIDIYEVGSYLQRHKYRYLRLAYGFFLAGAVLGAVSQGLALL